MWNSKVQIQGIVLSRDDRDKLNLLVDHVYKRFDPPIGREQVRLEWKKVDSAGQKMKFPEAQFISLGPKR